MENLHECTKSELDLFSSSPIQSSILRTTEVSYKPVNSISDDPSVIEFVCLGHGDTYRDLSSIYLRLRVRLLKNRQDDEYSNIGGDRPHSSSVVNNLLHSLFKQVSISLNGTPIAQSNNDYAYRAYFENLLNYGRDASDTHLDSVGWDIDDGDLDALDVNKNSGYKARSNRMLDSKVIELYGRLHGDLLNQNRLLLSNVDLRIQLSLNNPEIYVLEENNMESYVKITQATLYVNHVTVNPSVLLSVESMLTRTPAYYPYKRIEVKSYTVPRNSHMLSLDNVTLGQLPNLVIFAMVDNDAYVGKRFLNPFNLKHNNITQYNLLVNGVQVPTEPLDFNYQVTPAISTRGYQSLFKDLGIHYFDRGHQITKTLYDKGYFMVATDLTADHTQEAGACSNMLNQGTIRIEARFAKPLNQTITCLVYCEYDASIRIDKDRNVYTHF